MNKRTLDVRGLRCPMPIVKAKKEIDTMTAGELLEVLATDPGSMADFRGWARTAKHAALRDQRVDESDPAQKVYVHLLERTA